MAKDKLIDYDSTAANNTDIGGISIDEGMLPSNVNNALREVMSHLKDFAAGTEAISALDVAGTVTSDGLTVDGDAVISSANARLRLKETDTTDNDTQLQTTGGVFKISRLDDDNSTATQRFTIDNSTGDVSFYEDTGTTAKLFWDASAEALGIGTSSPDRLLHLASSAAIVCIEDTAGATDDKRAQIQVDNGQFEINSRNDDNSSRTDNIFVADLGTGNIGIGTNSPSTTLDVAGTITSDGLTVDGSATEVKFTTTAGRMDLFLTDTDTTDGQVRIRGDANTLSFITNTTNAMTIDASQNVLVSKTSSDTNTAGVEARNNGQLVATLDGGTALIANRKTSDGDVVKIMKDGSTVGSIGSATKASDTNVYIGSNDVNLYFFDNDDSISAVNSSGSDRDNAVDIGRSSTRFKDLYLGGTATIGTDSGDAFNTDSSLRLQDGGNNYIQIKTPSTNQAGLLMGDTDDDFAGGIIYNNSGDYLRFDSDNQERLRISGADFMFNQTTSSPLAVISATGGDAIGIASDEGYMSIKRNASGAALYINKTDSAGGSLIQFRADGTTFGSIGSYLDNYVYIGSTGGTDAHLGFVNGTVRPASSTGSVLDNTLDLGNSSARWDDIFATNGTIQTSDQNEKQQIASLTDAEITAAKAISKLFKTFKWNDSVEEKGDAARTHAGVIAQDVQQAMSDAGLDAGDYAFFISATWWEAEIEVPAVEAVEAVDAVYDDDNNLVSEAVEAVEAQEAYTRTDTYDTAEEAPEGATERTRMGIRYPELLAFIGAATEQRLADIETRLTALETL